MWRSANEREATQVIVPATEVLTHAAHVVHLPITRRLAVRMLAAATVGVAARRAAVTAPAAEAPTVSPDTSGQRLALVSGAQLRRLRKQSGWTQRELAERLGYSQQAVATWERNRNRLPASLVPRILDLLLDAKQQRDNLNGLLASIERWPTIGEW